MKKILITIMLFASAGAFGMRTNPPASDQSWENPLITAVRVNGIPKIKMQQRPPASDQSWKNPLIAAVRINDAPTVKRIINNVWDNKGHTVMRLLLAYKYREAWSEDELREYLDLQEQRVKDIIDYPDNHGNTALMTAVWADHLELVKYLTEHGANVNLSDDEGDTPLLMAIWADHSLELVKYLIEHGADIDRCDLYGSTPLIIATEIRNKKLVEYLTEHGADVNAQDKYQDTPLLIAAKKDYFELVKHLVEHGADVNKSTAKGNTPLWMAVRNGHVGIVRYLLSHGADANMVSENIKKYLINNTADLYGKDDIESVILSLSEYIRYKNILRLMRAM
ncbi:MAG: ankyrin repeat domain-containing protein [Alphaproteobacteria bacterium]|nr:ankyrin repeat domain-containing protein [Alphaproteobacteria bacterium]